MSVYTDSQGGHGHHCSACGKTDWFSWPGCGEPTPAERSLAAYHMSPQFLADLRRQAKPKKARRRRHAQA